ncbi:MAG: hypothetical protein KBH07_14365 [Flavobacteriales bacterium]|nr:hypothetical protein [Flavobacteriales bacterium]MBP9081424.1 hypothetical protein [Flavobacteriales bacterium]
MNPTIHFLRSCRTWAAMSLVLLASGCLTIEENYTFKKDGSGTMEYVVDLSQMAEMMKSFGDGKDKGELMESGSGEKVAQLKHVDGVKKVKLKREKDGYVERISFAFADVAALNRALNVLMPDSTGVEQTFFTWEGATLVRTNNRYAEAMGKEMAGTDSTAADMAEVLKSMHYKYSFKFAKDISGAKLADGVTREDQGARELHLATDWSVIMKDPKALDLRITLGE